jgi:hypothetical protein
VLPNPRFSGAAKKASCDRQLAHFRPVFTRIPADPHQSLGKCFFATSDCRLTVVACPLGVGLASLTDGISGAFPAQCRIGVDLKLSVNAGHRLPGSGIQRFLLVSVFPEAWRERHMDAGFEHYIAVKKEADMALSESGLDWVILRPSALKNDPGVGTVNLGVAQIHTEVRRDDVAATLTELIHAPAVSRKILELTEGDTPIAEAVGAVAGS